MPGDDRLFETKRAIRERLKNVCSHLSEDDFEQLVHKIALNELGLPATGVSRFDFTWKTKDP